MKDLPRRRLLAATGTALTVAVAGCSSSDDSGTNDDETGATDAGDEPDDSETGSTTTEAGGTILGDITIDNLDDSAHTVDVMVEFAGAIEAWATENVASNSGVDLERSWPADPGQLRVIVRLDQGDPVEITPANWNNPDCFNLFVRIDRDGKLTLLSETDGGPCGDGEADIDNAEEDDS